MDLSELILLMHHEVQKTYDLVDIAAKESGSSLHISLERIEIELPASLSEEEVSVAEKDIQHLPISLQQFKKPFTVNAFGKFLQVKTEVSTKTKSKTKTKAKSATIKGKTIGIKVLGPNDKLNEDLSAEFVGRLRIVLKPVIK